jgi:hypothetical protein
MHDGGNFFNKGDSMKVMHLSEEEAKFLAGLASNVLAIDGITQRWQKSMEFTERHVAAFNYIDQFCETFGYMYHLERNKFSKPC